MFFDPLQKSTVRLLMVWVGKANGQIASRRLKDAAFSFW